MEVRHSVVSGEKHGFVVAATIGAPAVSERRLLLSLLPTPVPDPPLVRTLGGDGLASHFLSFGAAQQQGMDSIGIEH